MSRSELRVNVDMARLRELGLPDTYVCMKCQLCGHTSVETSPLGEHVKGACEKFFPLWPWAFGTKQVPKGYTCLLLDCTRTLNSTVKLHITR